jgi:DNA-binding IclR family transcriptional regulator
VLECLAEHAVARGDVTVSCRSVRELADELDLSKDSVARALQRLRRDGLVAHVGDRGDDGRFGRGHYVLSSPAGVLASVGAASQRTPGRRTRTGPTQSTQQLRLMDDGVDGRSR